MQAVSCTLSAKDLGKLRAAIIEADSAAHPTGSERRDGEIAARFSISPQSVVAHRATLARFARQTLRRHSIDERFETDLKSHALRLYNSRTSEQRAEVETQAGIRAQVLGVSRGTLLEAADCFSNLFSGAPGIPDLGGNDFASASFTLRRSKLEPELRQKLRHLILDELVQGTPETLKKLEACLAADHKLSPFVLHALRAHVNKIFIHNACREHEIELSGERYPVLLELADRVINLNQKPSSKLFRNALLEARKESGLSINALRKLLESYVRQFRE